MEWLLGLVTMILAAHCLRKAWRYKTLSPLLCRKHNFGKRRDSLRATLELLEQRGARRLVETGVARNGLDQTKSEGASTIVFALWARAHGAHLHSVDIDPAAITRAQQVVDALGLHEYVTLHCTDSVAFLDGFAEPVDLLYLDSYDYHKTDVAIQRASQWHHLSEFRAIEACLHEDSVVLIDDCALPGGGKGKRVIDYMLARGWQLYREDYQVILGSPQPSATPAFAIN